ncbi:MAG: hypothetical protein K0S58_3264, partial [Nitrospira sp.]|nr:hypothetical protein [Nitrospira sp.]
DPDLILTGRVERFFEHDRRKLWTLVPYYSDKLAGLFRVNTYTTNGELRLTLTLLKPTGEVVGSYVGHAKFQEDYTPNSEVRPGDRLDRALGQALAQIRDEMSQSLSSSVRGETPAAFHRALRMLIWRRMTAVCSPGIRISLNGQDPLSHEQFRLTLDLTLDRPVARRRS